MLKRLARRLFGIKENAPTVPFLTPLVQLWDRDWKLVASSADGSLAEGIAFHDASQIIGVTIDEDYGFGGRHYRVVARVDEMKWTKPE